jgi:hypothetical protein
MKTKDNDQLIFTDSAKILRLTGVAFLIGCLFFLSSKMQFVLFAFAAVGIGLLLFSSDLTIVADRSTRVLQLRYAAYLFRKTKNIPFDDIVEIKALRAANYQKGYTQVGYRIAAVLKSGKNIPFRIYSTGDNGMIKIASQLHMFILGK